MAATTRWEKIERIGAGGQAEVWTARDTHGEFSSPCAMKLPRWRGNEKTEASRRFLKEIRVSEALRQSNTAVIEILDHGFADGRPYYVMPYYERGTLKDALERDELRDPIEALKSIQQLAAIVMGLGGNAHRDLKPANIVLENDGKPILCDFGIAWTLAELDGSDDLTATLEQLGSRHYMPPEALAGHRLGTNYSAFDIYAFGKIAYEVIGRKKLGGIEFPRGDYDLRVVRPELGSVAAIWNDTISRLLAHAVEPRVAAWRRMADDLTLIGDVIAGRPVSPSFSAVGQDIVDALESNEKMRSVRRAGERRDLAIEIGRAFESFLEHKGFPERFDSEPLRPLRFGRQTVHCPDGAFCELLRKHPEYPSGADLVLKLREYLVSLFAVDASATIDSFSLVMVPVALTDETVSELLVSYRYSLQPSDPCTQVSRVTQIGPYHVGEKVSGNDNAAVFAARVEAALATWWTDVRAAIAVG